MRAIVEFALRGARRHPAGLFFFHFGSGAAGFGVDVRQGHNRSGVELAAMRGFEFFEVAPFFGGFDFRVECVEGFFWVVIACV